MILRSGRQVEIDLLARIAKPLEVFYTVDAGLSIYVIRTVLFRTVRC